MRAALAMAVGAWLALVGPPCDAESTWIADPEGIVRWDVDGPYRIDSTTGVERLAATADGGLWTAGTGRLRMFSRNGAAHADLDLRAQGYGIAVSLAVDPYDDSAWVTTDRDQLLHVARDGDVRWRMTLPEVAGPLAIALDQSIWVVAGDQLLHIAGDGRWLAARQFSRESDAAPIALGIDSLGDQLWMATPRALQQMPLADTSAPLADIVRGAIMAMALDHRSGDVWVVVDRTLLAIGRDGSQRPALPSEMRNIDGDATLYFDSGTGSVVVAESGNVVRIDSSGSVVERTALAPNAIVAAPAPFRIDPALTLVRPPDGGATYDALAEIVLGIRADCNGSACGVLPPGYVKALRIDAEMNGVPMVAATSHSSAGEPSVSLKPGQALRTGPNRLTARLVDRFGHDAELEPASLTVMERTIAASIKAANKAPIVSLTAPANGATFTAGTSITLIASASDPDGAIAKVEFYRGATTLIGVATSAPYQYVWSNVAAGNYSLTAKAYDNKNATATSATAAITVVSNQLPVVTLTSPGNGSFHVAGASIPLAANAADVDGTIARVEFFDGSTPIGVVTAAPFGLSWTTASPGAHSVRARATDDKGGASDSATAAIVVGEPPVVIVTNPVACSQIDGPLDLMLAADASSAAGVIVKIDFFDGGTLVGTSYASPWRTTLANASPGSHAITARATDDRGLTSLSRPSLATVRTANQPPSVAWTSPAEGAAFPLGSTVTLTATATDADGSIVAVEFRIGVGGPLIGRATSPPYASTWTNMTSGSYTLFAFASDDRAATTTSAGLHVTIDPNRAPSVSLTAPGANATFTAPATIDLAANAADVDGTVAGVEFYAGTMLVGASTVSPYTARWSNVGAGAHSITAKATDNLGGVAISSPVPITVASNARPTVTLTSPATGTQYFSPATIVVSANAADNDGSVAKVEFYANGALIGSSQAAPYNVTWDNVAGGSYTLTAVATDNQGAMTTSAGVGVLVNANVTISASPGLDGSTLDDDSLVISGTINAPLNSGVLVNGVLAQIDADGRFHANGVPLAPGANEIVMTLVAQDGQTAATTISVSSSGPAPFAVTASPTEGLAPLAVTFEITNRANRAFQRIEFDHNGDGTVDYSVFPNQFVDGRLALMVTYPAGTFATRVTVFDSDNTIIHATTRVITVRTLQQQDTLLRNVYNSMLDRLRAGRIVDALKAVTGDMQDKYNAVFAALGATLPVAIAELGVLESNWFAPDHAEYVVLRDTADGPRGFLVDFIRGEDGVWRIGGM